MTPNSSAPARTAELSSPHAPDATRRRLIGLVVGIALLVAACAASLAVGSATVPLQTVWQALTGAHDSEAARIITTLRLPRSVLGLLAGAALGVAGALIQAVTR
ncbi:Fe(3+)-siderophore ABC transporter permease, partial [Propionibacterium freudenreichii]